MVWGSSCFWVWPVAPWSGFDQIAEHPPPTTSPGFSALGAGHLEEPLATSADDVDDSATDFQAVYVTANESVLELSNSAVHAAIHLAWIAAEDGSYGGQMGIYVKNRGRLGRVYMPAIAPFRHLIVYPALMRRLDRVWHERRSTASP